MEHNDKEQNNGVNKASANNSSSGERGFKARPYQLNTKDSEIAISSESSAAEKDAKQLGKGKNKNANVTPDKTMPISPDSKKAIENGESSGIPLSQSVKEKLGSTGDDDLINVKIHTSSKANELTSELNAEAFTYGNNIYFAAGKYNPESEEGMNLLQHELTHVKQQKGKPPHVQRRLSLSTREVVPQVNPMYVLSDGGESEAEFSHEQFGQALLYINRMLRTRTQEKIDMMRAHYEITHLGHSHDAHFGPTGESTSFWNDPITTIAAFLSDARGGTDIPLDAMIPAYNCINNSLQAYASGNYVSSFNHLMGWESAYQQGVNRWNSYVQASTQGASDNAENLQTISDVSLKISIGYFLRGLDGFTGAATTQFAVSSIQEVSREAGELLENGDTTVDVGDAFSRIAIASITDGVGSLAGSFVVNVLKGILGSLLMRHGGRLLIQALQQEGHQISRGQLLAFLDSDAFDTFVGGVSGDFLTTAFTSVISEFRSANSSGDDINMNAIKDALLEQLCLSSFINGIGSRIN